jgi:hypothetical protein
VLVGATSNLVEHLVIVLRDVAVIGLLRYLKSELNLGHDAHGIRPVVWQDRGSTTNRSPLCFW